MGPFEEIQDIFFEICPGIHLGLIRKRRCAARLDFSGDLFCYPGVLATVIHKNKALAA